MAYINKENLLATINEVWERKYGRCNYQPLSDVYRMIIRRINRAPVADVVEVVRCKDCIYNSNGSCTHSEIYDDTNYNPDYYCADGERRTDND